MKFYPPDVNDLFQRYVAKGQFDVTQDQGKWFDILRHSTNVRRYIPGAVELGNNLRAVILWAENETTNPLPGRALRQVLELQLRRIVEPGFLSGKDHRFTRVVVLYIM